MALLPNDPCLITEVVFGELDPIDHVLAIVFVTSVYGNVRNVSGTLLPPILP